MRAKKSWNEKLRDCKDLPRVGKIEGKLSTRWGTGTMVIPTPLEVDEIMRVVPKGKLITINEIRALLASKHHVTIACPITTGIFAWIAANAAAEDGARNNASITPYWRTLRSGGELNPKYPGGIDGVRKQLEAEGHTVVQKGKRYFVEGFEKALCKPSQFRKPNAPKLFPRSSGRDVGKKAESRPRSG